MSGFGDTILSLLNKLLLSDDKNGLLKRFISAWIIKLIFWSGSQHLQFDRKNAPPCFCDEMHKKVSERGKITLRRKKRWGKRALGKLVKSPGILSKPRASRLMSAACCTATSTIPACLFAVMDGQSYILSSPPACFSWGAVTVYRGISASDHLRQ